MHFSPLLSIGIIVLLLIIVGAPAEADLEEVINLLSCAPVQQFASKLRNKSLIPYPISSEQLSHVISKDSLTTLSGQIQNHQPWPKTDDNIKTDSLYWSLNDSPPSLALNSGAKRSHAYDSVEFYKQWECKDIQMYVKLSFLYCAI